ncbi:MAG: hypothetical protein AAFY34_07865 [Pseudomonadota bacterium]
MRKSAGIWASPLKRHLKRAWPPAWDASTHGASDVVLKRAIPPGGKALEGKPYEL